MSGYFLCIGVSKAKHKKYSFQELGGVNRVIDVNNFEDLNKFYKHTNLVNIDMDYKYIVSDWNKNITDGIINNSLILWLSQQYFEYNLKFIINISKLELSNYNNLEKVTNNMYIYKDNNDLYVVTTIPTKVVGECLLINSNFKSIDMSNLEIECSNISLMCANCRTAKLVLGKINTSVVTIADRVFGNSHIGIIEGLGALSNLKIDDMSSMFENLVTLNLTLENWKNTNVKKVNKLFKGLKANVLTLKDFSLNSVAYADSMFEDCIIDTLVINNNNELIFNNLSFFEYAFRNSKINSEIGIKVNSKHSLSLEESFESSTINSVTLDIATKDINVNSLFSYCTIDKLMVKRLASHTRGAPYLFACSKINELNIEGLSFREHDFCGMFTEAKIPYIDISNICSGGKTVTDADEMFLDCESEVINIGKLDFSLLSDLSGIFYGCTGKVVRSDSNANQSSLCRKATQ